MKKSLSMSLMSAAIAALFAVATPTFATPVTQTINLGQVFTGGTPNGQAPWLTATFMYDNDGSSHVGTLVLSSNLSGDNSLQGGGGKGNGVMGWGFNLRGNTLTAPPDCTTGSCADKVNIGNVNSGPVKGGFNLGFGWTSQNRFDEGDTATYSLTFADMLTASPFMANDDGYLSFAHVQGITGGGEKSGFIVNDPPVQPVPEPAALGMFGLGLLVLGMFAGLRRRFS